MIRRIILFILAFALWCSLVYPPDTQHVIAGILIALFVSWVTGDLFLRPKPIHKDITRYLWFFYYVPLFFWECIKANIDVARRVLHPDVPINPGIVRVNTELKSDTALTFLANSITLTPGTMTVDIDKENGCLYIHWIDVKDKDTKGATEIIVKKFEKVLKRIFE